jgi:hypothetical protein
MISFSPDVSVNRPCVDLSRFLQYNVCKGQYHRVNYQELNVKPTYLAVLGVLLVAAATVSPASAETALTPCLATGCIDWIAGVVRASGTGMRTVPENGREPDVSTTGLAAAQEAARNRLLETVASIRIEDAIRVSDRMANKAAFRDGLDALVKNAAIIHQEYLSDGTVKIELGMKLTGGFAQLVLPEEIRQVDTVTAVVKNTHPTPPAASDSENPADGPHTGLIIDATGIVVRPSMVPVIVNEAGDTIYGPAFVSREFAVSRGVCGFATTMEAALQDRRVGARPIIIRAIRTHGAWATTLVIANADAAYLRSSATHLDFLKACRVCIIIDTNADSIACHGARPAGGSKEK